MLHTLLYFLALVSLSTSSNWAKLNHMPTEVLGFYRLAFASALLAIWLFIVKRPAWPKLNSKMGWVLISGFFFFLHLWTFKYASKNTSVANTMIIFSSNPIWASLGAVIFFRERLAGRLILSYALALTGVYLLVAHNLQLSRGISYGDWAAVASALFYALYMLSGKKARAHYDNSFYSLIQYGLCALLFGACVLFTQAPLTGYDAYSWAAVAGLVLLPTFVGHFTLTYLVNYMNLSIMSCGKLVEPVLASIMAYYMFNETVGSYAWISFALTTASILVLFSPSLLKQFRKIFPLSAG